MLVEGANFEGAPFVIREQTGRKRMVSLRDRAGPFRGPPFSIGQRTKSTWYAGNPVGTLQLFGPTFDMPTQITGMWRDRYLQPNDTAALVEVEGFDLPETAEALCKLFAELVRSGATLEVTWSFVRRYGVLKTFTWKPERTEDIAWEAEFEWQGDAETQAPRSAPAAPELDLEAVKSAMGDLSDHAAFDPIDTLVAFEAKIFQAISDLESKTEDLLQAGRVLASALTLPARVVSSVRASATSIAFLAGQLIEEVVGAPYTTAQVVDDLGAVLAGESFRRDMAFFAGQLRASALDTARALEDRAEPDPVRIVVMDQSGSLRALAQREYGQADAWQTIADVNGFEGAYVPPGTEVFVPPIGAR